MRNLLWGCVLTAACHHDSTDTHEHTGSTDTTTAPPAEVCDPVAGMAVVDATVSQPWSEHEALFAVTLSKAAAVAIACQLDGDSSEVHLVERGAADTEHNLRLAGLLAGATYHCSVAPVCPSSSDAAFTLDLQTGPESNSLIPQINLVSKAASASGDYIVTNHQHNGSWNGQRRMVIDPDAHVRWHAATNAGGGAGGSAIGYSPTDKAFTIGGGWPPNNNGRPQLIDLYGSTVLYDTLPIIPNSGDLLFHHEARRLSDGRYLALAERVIDQQGGGTFDGFGVDIVNPTTNAVDFTWSSQAAYDAGLLPPSSNADDAYHPNWADVVDDVLHISLCNTRLIIAVDVPSGDLRWRFGEGGDWSLVDLDGNALPDSEFPQCQHGSKRRGDKLLVYDNGKQRDYSRVVEFQLDESTMTATKLWEWTEPEWHEDNLGGVDDTSGGGVLISMSHIEDSTFTPGDHTTFVEIDPVSGEKLWEIQYAEITDMAFRAETIAGCDIFADAKYCATTADRLHALETVLGVTAD